ncbi:TonB-dependent receptor [Bowmanella denitrificans]|uniref:TonB-dependent receptor n=1 Tax=Bowmanella denitrificans TaxID=366582 RepID=UPI000C9A6767|nr:TonB-dependent receptor [Bowmanella denitrificans]
MNKVTVFNRTTLASSISLLLGTSLSMPLLAQETAAQDDGSVEVIQVSGMRSSLQQATSIKRHSMGVVDAISAEDIGKFPDTNLAESLQRISGVSISRTNGEGSEVTVRGFGGDNNMVTLNGRTMPAATTYGAGSGADGTTRGGSTRAFDFANLASESIKSVEVFKTSKADITTGGLGATLNIITAKPLDSEGFVASAGVKAVHDTTNRTGDDLTPELSGIMSYANDESTFGVGLSFSHQERDSGYTGATVNAWNIGYWDDSNPGGDLYGNPGVDYRNAPQDGQLFARPNDIRYAFSNTQRVRDNAQLTLQFRPNDALTAAVDYTFAENELKEQRGEITNWVQGGGNTRIVEFDDSAVKTPVYIMQEYDGGVDEGYEQQWREQTNTLKSLGLNLQYNVSDYFSLTLDAHDSEMYSRGTGPRNTGELAVGLGAPTVVSREWFWGMDLPTYKNVYDDSIRGANNNGQVDAGDVGSSVARLRNASQKTEISQVKLDGQYVLEDGRFDFGVELRTMESRSMQTAGRNIDNLGGWGIAFPGEFDAYGLIQPFDLPGEFDDYDTMPGGYGFIADARALYDAALELYPNANPALPTASETALSFDNTVKEETQAVYFQVALGGELGGMPFDVLTGLRYEKTDVTSTSLVNPVYFSWDSNDDVNPHPGTGAEPTSLDSDYDYLLPSLDFSLDITEDLKGRFSFGKTIGRAGLGDLGVSYGNFGGGGGSTLLGAQPTADGSNPGLLPLESSNYDLSLEWYYSPDSYASIGLFQKNVINFIGRRQVDQKILGIRDVTGGPRAQAAMDALNDLGVLVDNTSLFTMMVILNNPTDFPGGAGDYNNLSPQDIIDIERDYDLLANESDPETTFRTSIPDNSREAKLYGAELAIQHFFGDSGFGVQANYTIVRGDVGFDSEADPDQDQFALLGLSDTANLIAMYEKEGWQARIAWNWRDKYLAEVNKGADRNPRFVEAYWQIDVNVSYDISEDLTVFVEGLNITGENDRQHARNEAQLWYLTDLGARYQIGARYAF